MSSIKKRSPRRSTPRGRITKVPCPSKTPRRRPYWMRSDPCPSPIMTRIFRVTPAKRRPLYPHTIHADRLIPFRPDNTLDAANRRQEALDTLREISDSKKGDSVTTYYTTALQGEILNAPLRVKVDRERAVLQALPDRLFLHFSRPMNQPTHSDQQLATHPLQRGKLSRALDRHGEFSASERVIAKAPYKILDAPDLKDDFYYNLLDWSSKNVLAVGLGCAVYLWTATTGHVEDVNAEDRARGEVSSVAWSQGASALAVGSRIGTLQLWDPHTKQRIITFLEQANRVGSLSWNLNKLASGCRNGNIQYFDHRCRNAVRVISGHRSEVCGLKWSSDNLHLASGGNDNRVNIWDIRRTERPIWQITEHTAAVKAISWSPHNNKHFVTGGGLKDVHIKMWNLNTMERDMDVNAYAQVCGLHWSQNANEIVSTHGYNSNCIQLWKAPTMECLGTFPGHATRVVYLAASPDGQSIATGSGDESVRFFKVFPPVSRQRDIRRAQRDRVNLSVR